MENYSTGKDQWRGVAIFKRMVRVRDSIREAEEEKCVICFNGKFSRETLSVGQERWITGSISAI